MKRKDWVGIVGFLILILLIDLITKYWATGISERNVGFIKFILVHNHGALLGLFSELPAILRIVTLSTSGVFVLSFYALAQYLIPGRLMSLRLGLTILVGGILGNVLDRILYGYVVDFISISFADWNSPVWNLADAIQWIGYAILVTSILKNGQLLWPDHDIRKSFWINKKFQMKFSILFTVIGLFLTLISLVFSYTYLKVTIEEIAGPNKLIIEKFSEPLLYTYLILAMTYSLILFFFGKVISHRIAGPLFSFERFLKDAVDGKGLDKNGKALQLRTNDEFKHLEELAEQLRDKLIHIHTDKK